MAVEWDEISDAASSIFNVWTSGGDLSFAKETWSHLTTDELTSDEGVYDLTRTYLRLIALRLIYGEFCAAKWDQGFETPVSYLVEDLEINLLALGLMASSGLERGSEFLGDEFALREAALTAAIETLKPEIFSCLLNAYGGAIGLYSRLSRTAGNLDKDDQAGDGATVSGDCAALDFINSHRKS